MVNVNNNLRKYLKPISDISYVTGEGFGRTDITAFSQIKALADLYHVNESLIIQGKLPYMKIDVDDNGIKYAEITKEFITLASNIPGCFNPAKVDLKPLSTKVKLSKARDIVDETSFEETIDDKLTRDMYERVVDYAGVKEIPSNDSNFKKYGMIFVPSSEKLENKDLEHRSGKGIIVDARTEEPIVKTLEFKLFSN